MSEIMKCPMCGNDMEMEPWRWPECTKCPFSCAILDLPRIAAAMELARACVNIDTAMRTYDDDDKMTELYENFSNAEDCVLKVFK